MFAADMECKSIDQILGETLASKPPSTDRTARVSWPESIDSQCGLLLRHESLVAQKSLCVNVYVNMNGAFLAEAAHQGNQRLNRWARGNLAGNQEVRRVELTQSSENVYALPPHVPGFAENGEAVIYRLRIQNTRMATAF